MNISPIKKEKEKKKIREFLGFKNRRNEHEEMKLNGS